MSALPSIEVTNQGLVNATFNLVVNGNALFANTDQILQEIEAMPAYETQGAPLATWAWMLQNTYHWNPFTDAGWQNTPYLYMNSIGLGFCDDVANIYAQLLSSFGYASRIWSIDGHVVSEVLVSGNWQIFDVDLRTLYLDSSGEVQGYDYVSTNQDDFLENLLNSEFATIPYAPWAFEDSVLDLYRTTNNNLVGPPGHHPDFAGQDTFVLPPGASLTVENAPPTLVDSVADPLAPARSVLKVGFGTLDGFVFQYPLIPISITGSGSVTIDGIAYVIGSEELDARIADRTRPIFEIVVDTVAADNEIAYLLNPQRFSLTASFSAGIIDADGDLRVTLAGSDGADRLTGTSAGENLSGGLGDDTLIAQPGHPGQPVGRVLDGGAGNDLVEVLAGANGVGIWGDSSFQLRGGAGVDRFVLAGTQLHVGSADAALLDGGAGFDTLIWNGSYNLTVGGRQNADVGLFADQYAKEVEARDVERIDLISAGARGLSLTFTAQDVAAITAGSDFQQSALGLGLTGIGSVLLVDAGHNQVDLSGWSLIGQARVAEVEYEVLQSGSSYLGLAIVVDQVLTGTSAGESLTGGLGDDTLIAQPGQPDQPAGGVLNGGAGNDLIEVLAGPNGVGIWGSSAFDLLGGTGDDLFVLAGTQIHVDGAVMAQLDGGAGFDTLAWNGSYNLTAGGRQNADVGLYADQHAREIAVRNVEKIDLISARASGLTLTFTAADVAAITAGSDFQQARLGLGLTGVGSVLFVDAGHNQLRLTGWTLLGNVDIGGAAYQVLQDGGRYLVVDSIANHVLGERAATTGADAPDTAAATISFTDIDLTRGHSLNHSLVSSVSSGGSLPDATAAVLADALALAVAGPGSVTARLSLADRLVDFLAAGETLTLVYEVTVTDDGGTSSVRPVTFTITGSNDAPVLAADSTASHVVTEQPGAGGLESPNTAVVVLDFADADVTDSHRATYQLVSSAWSGGAIPDFAISALAGAPLARALSLSTTISAPGTGSVTVQFSVPDALVDFLAAGETLTLVYEVTLADRTGSSAVRPVTFTVTGANDGPELGSAVPDLSVEANVKPGVASGAVVTALYAAGSKINLLEGLPELTTQSDYAFTHNPALTSGYNFMGGHDWFVAHGISAGELAGGTIVFADGTTGRINFASGGAEGATPESAYVYYQAYTPGEANLIERVGATGSESPDTASAVLSFADLDHTDSHTLDFSLISSALSSGSLPDAVSAALADAVSLALTFTAPGTGLVTAQFALPGQLVDFLAIGETLTVTYDVSVTDETGASAVQAVTFIVTGTNDAPSIAGLVPAAFVEGAGTVAVAPLLSLSDVDDSEFASATATITAGYEAGQDVLSFANTSEAIYGNITASFDDGALFLNSAGGTATVEQWQAALRAVQFTSLSDAPAATPRTVTFIVNDGEAHSPETSMTVTVGAINDAPSLTAATDATIVFAEDDASIPLMQGVVLSDMDRPASFAGGRLELAVGDGHAVVDLRAGSSFVLISNGDGTFGLARQESSAQVVIGTISGLGTSRVTVSDLTADATLDRLNNLIDDFTVSVDDDNPSTSTRQVELTVHDGGNSGAGGSLSASVLQSLEVVPANDAPALDLNGAAPDTSVGLSYVENQAPTRIAPLALAGDVDSPDFAGGGLQVTIANGLNGEDLLTILNQGTGAGQIGFSNGVITYQGQKIGDLLPATPATPVLDIRFGGAGVGAVSLEAVEALVRAIAYQNLSDVPDTTPRSIEFRLEDPDAGATTTIRTATVVIVPANDAPAGADATLTIAEDSQYVFGLSDFGFTDVDGDELLRVDFLAPGGGTLYELVDLGALGSAWSPLDFTGQIASYSFDLADIRAGAVKFVPNADQNGAGVVSIVFRVVDDGARSSGSPAADPIPNTLTLDVTPVDDPGVAQDDRLTTTEAAILSGSLFADNGAGADLDIDNALRVQAVNGAAAAVGTWFQLASGARLLVGADGSYQYDPNGAFGTLPGPASGAVNLAADDSFTYRLVGGGTAAVSIRVTGLDGDDVLLGSGSRDVMKGETGKDILSGAGGDDQLSGGSGNDYLDGGIGADLLNGGSGDDAMIVDAADLVVEAVGGGFDNVAARTSFTLSAGAEVEVLSTADHGGRAAIDLIGNEFDQSVIGNAGDNYLDGGGGVDRLQGLGGNDTMIVDPEDLVFEAVGGGLDNVAARASYVLNAGAEVEVLSTTNHAGTANIYLVGNSFGQTIIGNAGNNYLDGGGGRDRLQGFGGDDTMIVDIDDSIIESFGGGFDTAATRTSYTLAVGVEVEVLMAASRSGTSAINLSGNEIGQVLAGNDGNNVIDGYLGNDLLLGFGGADTFVFASSLGSNNIDTIGDMVSGVDRIALSATVFAGLSPGALPSTAFVTGTRAQDSNDRILYDPATGALYFDADGSGAIAAVQFATLQGAPTLAASDFIVI